MAGGKTTRTIYLGFESGAVVSSDLLDNQRVTVPYPSRMMHFTPAVFMAARLTATRNSAVWFIHDPSLALVPKKGKVMSPWLAFDQTDASRVLSAELYATNYTAATTVSTRLGTSAPTATANMTQLGGGTGYTTGGTVMTWNNPSAAATSNASTASWTNGSGGAWSIVGLEIWGNEGTPLRHLWGTWTGQPVSIANGNTFAVAAAGISVTLV